MKKIQLDISQKIFRDIMITLKHQLQIQYFINQEECRVESFFETRNTVIFLKKLSKIKNPKILFVNKFKKKNPYFLQLMHYKTLIFLNKIDHRNVSGAPSLNSR